MRGEGDAFPIFCCDYKECEAMALYVTAVDENSPAEKFGITVGCALLAIDGHPLNDALDYQF